MGTSKGYRMPTGGDWTPLKTEATNFVKDGGHGSVAPEKLLSDYLKANGGAKFIAHAGSSGKGGSGSSGGAAGGSGGGGGGRGGRAARNTGRNLGGFLSRVGAVGLDDALREVGLSSLIGKSAEDVSAGLLDVLAEPGSSLDEHASRIALAKLYDEMFKSARTYEDVGRILSTTLDSQGLAQILARFFGQYIYARFARDFYENWLAKEGPSRARASLKSIKDCIESSLKTKLVGRDLTRLNWRGKDGLRLTEQVMRETLEIFEVSA
jgi:hypothetical protein